MRPAVALWATVWALACTQEPQYEPDYARQAEEARRTEVVAQLRAVWDALTMYRLHVGEYPGGEAGLLPLLPTAQPPSPNWKGPYLRRVPHDPWGNLLLYQRGNAGITIRSAGPDGLPGTQDDIAQARSWAELQ